MFNLFNKKLPSEKLSEQLENELRTMCLKICKHPANPMLPLLVDRAIEEYGALYKSLDFWVVLRNYKLESNFTKREYEILIDKVLNKIHDEFIK